MSACAFMRVSCAGSGDLARRSGAGPPGDGAGGVRARVGETRAGAAGRRGRDEHSIYKKLKKCIKTRERESRGEKNAERAAGGEFLRVQDKARRGVLGTCALCTEPRKSGGGVVLIGRRRRSPIALGYEIIS